MKPLTVLVLLIATTQAVNAQQCSIQFDPAHSTARLFVGTAMDPEALNVGVARVIGKMILDRNRPAESAFDLALYPAGTGPVGTDGRLASGKFPNVAAYSGIFFKATNTVATEDGLRMTGILTLIHVNRNPEVVMNEAYAGPAYNNPVVTTSSQEVTFLVVGLKFDCTTPSTISTSAQVRYESFRELRPAILDTNWPPIVENEQCQNPGPGEDYAGLSCTGTTVLAICRGVVASVGEDYHGFTGEPVIGDRMTIRFDLRVVPVGSAS